MHLVSETDQTVELAGQKLALARDEAILTEYSHKYDPGKFRDLCRSVGFEPRDEWTDERGWFAVHLYEVV